MKASSDFAVPFHNAGRIYDAIVRLQPRSGVLVADYLATNWAHSSRLEWADRIEQGLLTVDDVVATSSTRIYGNELLRYHRPGWDEPPMPPLAALERARFPLLPTLHSDEDLLALHKPSGLPVMPGGMFEERSVLKLVGGQGDPVQRLGRGTSGLLLLARTEASARTLSAAFRNRELKKEYLAILQGKFDPPGASHSVSEPIVCMRAESGTLKGAQQAHWWCAASDAKKELYEGKPKPSDSYFTVLGHGIAAGALEYTLCRVRIGTGRAHQIRFVPPTNSYLPPFIISRYLPPNSHSIS